jgi:hypothetical protein
MVTTIDQNQHEHPPVLDPNNPLKLGGVICAACGEGAEFYMLRDKLWARVAPKSDNDNLCLACVEARLGRSLKAEDYRFTPQELAMRLIMVKLCWPKLLDVWALVLGDYQTDHRLFDQLIAGPRNALTPDCDSAARGVALDEFCEGLCAEAERVLALAREEIRRRRRLQAGPASH